MLWPLASVGLSEAEAGRPHLAIHWRPLAEVAADRYMRLTKDLGAGGIPQDRMGKYLVFRSLAATVEVLGGVQAAAAAIIPEERGQQKQQQTA